MGARTSYKSKHREQILAILQENEKEHMTAGQILDELRARGIAIGVATMLAIAKIFQLSGRLATDGTVRPEDAVGATGSVYLAIRPGRIGKVRVTARGALKVFDARAKDPAADLPTGTPVSVAAAEDVLVVEPRA